MTFNDRNKIQNTIPGPLSIFGSRLHCLHNSQNVNTNCLSFSTSLSNAAWGKDNLASVTDGYADPFGGNNACLITSNATSGIHRITQAYTNTVGQQTITVYFKQLSGRIFDLLPNPAYCQISQTGAVVGTNMAVKTESLPNGWIKVTCRYASTASDGVFRIYPFGNIIISNAGEQCAIYMPTLDNGQPISLPDLSGNGRTFTQNTAGGIIDRSNATIARFGQQSLTLTGAQGYINYSPPNENYTAIVVGALNSSNIVTSNTIYQACNGGIPTEDNSIRLYSSNTQAIQALQTCKGVNVSEITNTLNPVFNNSKLLVCNCFFPYDTTPISGNINSDEIISTINLSKSSFGNKSKMILGNNTTFSDQTTLFHFFELIMVKGALTDIDNQALQLYIQETYNQSFFPNKINISASSVTSDSVLLDYDFSTLAAGGIAAPTNFLTPCASAARTVQTGKSTVASGIAANLALIGREQDYWDLGLVVEGPVVNYCTAPRTFTGGNWQAGANETFVAQAAGTDSPDGSVNSPAIVVASTNYSRYLVATTSTAMSLRLWRRQYAPSQRRVTFYDSLGYASDAALSTQLPTTWEASAYVLPARQSALNRYAQLIQGGGGSGYLAAAASARFDMILYESGMSIPHEFYEGTKAGGGLTVNVSQVVVSGRLSMYLKCRPKGSINDNNPWTYNPHICYLDANNGVQVNTTTGIITVKVVGASYTTPIPINFYRASMLELWIEAGGGSLATVVKAKVDGILTTLGTSGVPQGTFPNSGTLGICCNPADLTTGQFEAWINRVTFYYPGGRHPTFATEPYQLMYDFTGLSVGAGGTSIAAQIAPAQNLIPYSQTFTSYWGSVNTTLATAAGTAPDGTNTANSITETVANAVHYGYAAGSDLGVPVNSTITTSIYAKSTTRQYVILYARNILTLSYPVLFDIWNGTVVGNASGWAAAGVPIKSSITPAGNGWFRLSVTHVNPTSFVGMGFGLSNTGNAAGPFSYAGDIGQSVLVWGAQIEIGSQASTYSPNLAATTTGAVTFACATAGRTVQTGDSTVVSGIAANAIRVGRESSKWLPGLVLEGAVTNSVVAPRLITPAAPGATAGWNTGGTETFSAQAAGTYSPDGTVTSPRLQVAAGQYSRYFVLASSTAPGSINFWRNTSGNKRRGIANYGGTGGTLSAPIETGVGAGVWEKLSTTIATASTGATWNILLEEGRAANGYAGTSAADGYFDFVQLEVGSKVVHEFIDGVKAAENLSVPVSSAVINGRLGFYCRFRPKFSSNTGANPLGYTTRFWRADTAGDQAYWDTASTNKLNIQIAGVTQSSSNVMPTMARGDDVQVFIECGNGITLAWVIVNNVITTMSFNSTAQASITGTTLWIYQSSSGGTPLEAWHATFRTYLANKRPDWQDPNILWKADFTKLQAGTDTKPDGMTVLCATAARTVQVGDNAVVSAIAADVPLIGRENSTWNLGAVLDGAVNNVITDPRTFAGWAAGSGNTFTAQAAGIISPDNTINSANDLVPLTKYGKYIVVTMAAGVGRFSYWAKTSSSSLNRVSFSRGATVYTLDGTSYTQEWRRYQIAIPAGASNTVTLFNADGRAVTGFSGAGSSDASYDFVQCEAGNIPHEFTTTSKAGTVHSIPAATIVSSSRLSLHYIMRPKGSIGGLNPWTTEVYVWCQDASNRCTISTAGIITSTIAGVSSTALTGITFSRGDRIELWYAGGGGLLETVVKLRINGGIIQTFTLDIQGTVPATGTIGLGCDWNAPATKSFEGWYEYIAAYSYGASVGWAT